MKILGTDVDIQVKYSTTGEVYLTENEAELMLESSKENGWILGSS